MVLGGFLLAGGLGAFWRMLEGSRRGAETRELGVAAVAARAATMAAQPQEAARRRRAETSDKSETTKPPAAAPTR